MRVALTGATGFLGRNLLFEIVKRNLHALDRLQVVVLGRRRRGHSLKDRVRDILLTDGSRYIGLSEERDTVLREFCERSVDCIEMDLELDGLGLDDGNPVPLLPAVGDLRATHRAAARKHFQVRRALRLEHLLPATEGARQADRHGQIAAGHAIAEGRMIFERGGVGGKCRTSMSS